MAITDLLAGFAEAGHAHNTNLLQLQYEQAKDLGEKYFQIAQDPNTPPEVSEEASNRVIGLHTLAPGKKIPKEWTDFTFVVQPKPMAPTNIAAVPSPIPGLPNIGEAQTIAPPPQAPPHMVNMGTKIPYEEQTARIAARTKATSDASYHPPVDTNQSEYELYKAAAAGDPVAIKAIQMKQSNDLALHPTPPPKSDTSISEVELAIQAAGDPNDPKTVQAQRAMDILQKAKAAGTSKSDTDKYAELFVKKTNGTATPDELTTLKAYEAKAALAGSGMMLPVQQPTGPVVYTPRAKAEGQAAPRGEVSEAAQSNLGGWKQEVDAIDQLMPTIKSMSKEFGPLGGRVTLAQIEQMGGLGATKEQINLATELRRLLTSEAFANGGKQLTDTEKVEFQALLPHLSDTFTSAVTRAEVARKYLLSKGKTRLEAMPVGQFNQMQPALRGFFMKNPGAAAAPTRAVTPSAPPRAGYTVMADPAGALHYVKDVEVKNAPAGWTEPKAK